MVASSLRIVALLLVGLLSSHVLGAQESAAVSAMHGLGDVRHHRLDSEVLGRSFEILVALPAGYADDEASRYPTVYLLDGGATFPMLGGYSRYLNLAEEIPDLILVGISYGTDDWQKGNLRGTDFTAPAADREHYGGASSFQRVLRTELLPLIEGTYRARPDRRIVFGQSLGGQFVLYSALTDPQLFWGHIASNPALHRNLDFFQQPHWGEAGAGESRVFVSSATGDSPRFRTPAKAWMEAWTARDDLPFRLEAVDLEGHNHFSAATAAFRRGMGWLFGSR